jgi:hypothetical protein
LELFSLFLQPKLSKITKCFMKLPNHQFVFASIN